MKKEPHDFPKNANSIMFVPPSTSKGHTMSEVERQTDWAREVLGLFRLQRVKIASFVPDSGLKRLISLCQGDPDMHAITLTTEEEGIALAAGAYLGGTRSVLFMQSSGVGNCLNMLSLPTVCNMPLFMLVTMRGEWGEFNPWQVPMGQSTQRLLEAGGVIVQRAEANW
jgi:sulfopyruvate decarboxylase alpha subunit